MDTLILCCITMKTLYAYYNTNTCFGRTDNVYVHRLLQIAYHFNLYTWHAKSVSVSITFSLKLYRRRLFLS